MSNGSAGAALAVEAERLGHRFGDRAALSDVSFGVTRGEIAGLLGPNGGGKTTLFRILATLLRPSEGDARLFGASVTSAAHAARRRLGVVFQRPSLDPKLTVLENLLHHGHLYGLAGAELRGRAAEALEVVGVAPRARDRVETLSGGMQRRVELAKSILHRPDLLLLDEPNTGLDPNARREFMTHLESLRRREGTTVLLTTHFLEEAERCDRVGILHLGRLVAYEQPASLKAGIGGDVVVVQSPDPPALAAEIQARFGHPSRLVNGGLRIETPRGHLLVGGIVEAFPGRVSSITWGQPTLEDVFVHLTGHKLEEEAA
jgi:ABC-2 type transport system ATP-binding protein